MDLRTMFFSALAAQCAMARAITAQGDNLDYAVEYEADYTPTSASPSGANYLRGLTQLPPYA